LKALGLSRFIFSLATFVNQRTIFVTRSSREHKNEKK
jgi:hypothetical protein